MLHLKREKKENATKLGKFGGLPKNGALSHWFNDLMVEPLLAGTPSRQTL